MSSNFGRLAYCYKLSVNGEGAEIAKYCYVLSVQPWFDEGDTDLGPPRASHPKISTSCWIC